MKKALILVSLFCSLLSGYSVNAQDYGDVVTYKELYDRPDKINKLFLGIQPIYGELYASNVNAGFGFTAQYYHEDLFDVSLAFRKAYGQKYDQQRDAAVKNADISMLTNTPRIFSNFEIVGTYHIIDEISKTKSKVALYSDSDSAGYTYDWDSKMAEIIMVTSKVRTIIGGRIGGMIISSTTDVTRAIADQNYTPISNDITHMAMPTDTKSLFGNYQSNIVFAGASMAWIKNFAIIPDQDYDSVSNDLILTTYADFLWAPSVVLEDMQYRPDPLLPSISYSLNGLERNNVGFRLGVEGKFNREIGWAYGLETGIRPGIKKKGFFFAAKVTMPLFSTSLEDQNKEAFGRILTDAERNQIERDAAERAAKIEAEKAAKKGLKGAAAKDAKKEETSKEEKVKEVKAENEDAATETPEKEAKPEKKKKVKKKKQKEEEVPQLTEEELEKKLQEESGGIDE